MKDLNNLFDYYIFFKKPIKIVLFGSFVALIKVAIWGKEGNFFSIIFGISALLIMMIGLAGMAFLSLKKMYQDIFPGRPE